MRGKQPKSSIVRTAKCRDVRQRDHERRVVPGGRAASARRVGSTTCSSTSPHTTTAYVRGGSVLSTRSG